MSEEKLTIDERLNIALTVGEECVSADELRNLLEKKPKIIAYVSQI